MRRHSTLLIVATVVAMLAVAGCGGDDGGSSDNGEGSELVVGYAAALTGDGAIGDVPALEGVEYAIEGLNADGGIDGHTVRLVAKDMKSDSALGGTVTQELIDEGAQVVIGPPFPGMAAGVIEVAGDADVAVISATSTQPEFVVVGGHPAFLAAFGDNVQASAAAEYALDQGARTVFTVSSPDLTYTGNTPKFFVDAFEQGGGTTLGDVTFTIGQTDFSAQVTKIANLGEKPDVIYTTMFPPDTTNFIRALRAAGVESRVVGADGFHTDAVLEAGQDALEGTWFTTHAFDRPDTPFGDFVVDITEANGQPPEAPALAGLGYTTMQVIAAAVSEAGSTDPAAIADAMASLEDVETVTGTISYAGTPGVPDKTVTIGGIEGGAFVYKDEFVPEYVAEP